MKKSGKARQNFAKRIRYHAADTKRDFSNGEGEAPGRTAQERDHQKPGVGKLRRVVGPAMGLREPRVYVACGSGAPDKQNRAGQNGQGNDKKRKAPKTRKSEKKRKIYFSAVVALAEQTLSGRLPSNRSSPTFAKN